MATVVMYEAQEGPNWVIHPVGEVDLASAPELDELIDAAMKRWAAGNVVVDLAQVDFMDSAGLRVLVTAAKASRANGNRLRVRRPLAALQRLFDVSGAGALLPLE